MHLTRASGVMHPSIHLARPSSWSPTRFTISKTLAMCMTDSNTVLEMPKVASSQIPPPWAVDPGMQRKRAVLDVGASAVVQHGHCIQSAKI